MTAHGTDHDPPDDAEVEPATAVPDDQVKPSRLAQLLKDGRRKWQPTMARLRASQLSGVNVSSIEAWETGRVAKPPIHDVMRLAHVLLISPKELQEAVYEDYPLPEAARDAAPPGWLLLERAMTVMEWGVEDVATGLSTTPERVRELRDGVARPSQLETVTLGIVLGAYPRGLDGASNDEVFALLEQMRS